MASNEDGTGIVGIDKANLSVKAMKDNGLTQVQKGLNNIGGTTGKPLQKEEDEDERMDIDG